MGWQKDVKKEQSPKGRCRRPFSLKAGDDEFDEVVADGGAGTEFEAVTDFVAECVEGVCGT
jgi:hypothetical protein